MKYQSNDLGNSAKLRQKMKVLLEKRRLVIVVDLIVISCPLKISENQRLSDVFRGYRKRLVAWID